MPATPPLAAEIRPCRRQPEATYLRVPQALTGGVSLDEQFQRPGASARCVYTDGRYLVTFADEPVASYDGYGLASRQPARPGRKLDANNWGRPSRTS